MISRYGSSADESEELSLDEWTHVLKLSTMWGFHELRYIAIDSMKPLLKSEDPVRRIVLARKYDVRVWLLPALHALARRPRSLQLHEVEPLGIATIVKIAEVRDTFPVTGSSGSYHRRTVSASRETHNFEEDIRRVFQYELIAEGINVNLIDEIDFDDF